MFKCLRSVIIISFMVKLTFMSPSHLYMSVKSGIIISQMLKILKKQYLILIGTEPLKIIRGYRGQNSGGSRMDAGLESAVAVQISHCNQNQSSQGLEASSSFLKLLQGSSRFLKQQPEPESMVNEICWQKTNHKSDVFCRISP